MKLTLTKTLPYNFVCIVYYYSHIDMTYSLAALFLGSLTACQCYTEKKKNCIEKFLCNTEKLVLIVRDKSTYHTHTHTHTRTPQQGSPKNDGFVVTQFHLTEWPPHQVPNTGTLIEMLDMVTKNQMSTGNRPITVMCKYVRLHNELA